MRKRIRDLDGTRHIYDTETADWAGERFFGTFGDPAGYKEELFRTRSGCWFVYGEGGATSPYPNATLAPVTHEFAATFFDKSPQNRKAPMSTPDTTTVDIVALDMDGTLLDSTKHVLPSSLEVLNQAAKKGVTLTLCTGRSPRMVHLYDDVLDSIRYAICVSGAQVFDLATDTLLVNHTLPAEVVDELVERVYGMDVMLELYLGPDTFVAKDQIDMMAHWNLAEYIPMFYQVANPEDDIFAWVRAHSSELAKFTIHFTDPQARAAFAPTIAHLPVNAAASETSSLEISSQHISKASGLFELCEKLGISHENTLAVGDGGNDVEVLQAAALGVAMANAHPDAKAVADVILDNDNDHGGIAEAFKRFVL